MVFWEGTQPRVHETGPFTHQAEAVPLDNFDHDSNLGTETLLTPSAPTHLLPSLKQSLERAVYAPFYLYYPLCYCSTYA
jgi:hypothetical protein